MSEQTIEEKKNILSKYNFPYEKFQKFEELRGCPIELWNDEETVEYEEYYSPELRDKKPLVTVLMITYNHEKYIAEAIEGVVMQKCNFPIELVIVEDHSSDGTLEICKDYQKRYSEIIHLFTANERKPFVLAHILKSSEFIDMVYRGEYIAFCEGDDYWTDMNKLQKQIDILRTRHDINLVATNYLKKNKSINKTWWCECHNGNDVHNLYHEDFPKIGINLAPFQTAGVVIKKAGWQFNLSCPLTAFKLKIGDIQLFINAVYPNGQYYVLKDYMYVYRQHSGGATAGNREHLMHIDQKIVLAYFDEVLYGELVDAKTLKWDIRTWDDKYELALLNKTSETFIEKVLSKVRCICKEKHDNTELILEIQNLIMNKWLFRTERPLLSAIALELNKNGILAIANDRFWLIRLGARILPCLASVQFAHWMRRFAIKLHLKC